MPLTAYPGLLAGQGSPYLNLSPLVTTGKMWFVSSVIGRTNNVGDDPLRPISTLQTAYNKCRANYGDHVIILPGHAENITAAAGINFNIAGVTVIGMGSGASRPTFTHTTVAGASWDINAASNTLANVVINATGVAAVTAAMNVKAADFTYINNRMVLANATNQAVLGILTTNAASRMRIGGFSQFVDASGPAAGYTVGTTNAISIVGGDGIVIGDPMGLVQMTGAYDASLGAIQGLTTDTTNILFTHLYINNATASSTKCIILTAGSTGAFTNCRFGILSGTAPVTGAAITNLGGSYYKAAAGVAPATLV